MKYDLGLYQAAIADYDTAIQLKPDYAYAYVNRGVAKDKLRQPAAAIVDLNTALNLAEKAGNTEFSS